MSYMTAVLKGLTVPGFKHVATGISCTCTKRSSVNYVANRMSGEALAERQSENIKALTVAQGEESNSWTGCMSGRESSARGEGSCRTAKQGIIGKLKGKKSLHQCGVKRELNEVSGSIS